MTGIVTCPDTGEPAASAGGHCAHCLLAIGLLDEEDLTEIKAGHTSSGDRAGEARFAPGAVFGGRFRITGFIGRGGMGEIYRAFDLKLGQDVAIKFIANERPTEEALRRFYDEVRLGRQVAHPSVCRVYELLEIDGLPFIVMEFVDGENLGSLLKRMGKLPYREALRIAREVCAGVSAAHERGILHGDLKPTNIMIDDRGHARITDFGLARLASDTKRGLIGGTFAYMAPEQLNGAESTRSSDIYALGVVLHEIFTGRHPVADENPRHRPSSIQPKIAGDLERVILQCLASDPQQRPESARDVLRLVGGDFLDPMMLAGETPSPEYVAASRKISGLQAWQAWTIAAVSAAVLLLLLFFSDRLTLYGRAELTQSPAALAARARRVAVELGGGMPIADEGYWFEANLAQLQRHAGPDADRAVEHPFSPIEFHYRASRSALAPLRADGVLRRDDPPPIEPGMAHIVLAPDGRVLRHRTAAEPKAPEIAVEPIAVQRLTDTLYTSVLLLAIVAGFFLARYNIRLRRIDRRGATRLAIWVFLCRAVYGVVASHHPLSLDKEPGHIAAMLGAASLMAAEVLIAYLALEPFVRRRWPALMIGWMRFGQGRLRDSVVGREILCGVLAGLMFRLLDHARNAAPLLLPSARVIPSHLAVDTLASMRVAIGAIFYYQARAIFYALFALFLLLLLQMLVRSERAATVLWVTAATAMFIRWGDLRIDVPIVALQMVVLLFVMRRFGLLSLIAAVFIALLTVHIPLTITASRFYFGSSSLVVAIVAALLVAGVTATASRRWSPSPPARTAAV